MAEKVPGACRAVTKPQLGGEGGGPPVVRISIGGDSVGSGIMAVAIAWMPR